jgi:uncharacterized protein YutE (UPF0331/DUF86 family)
MPVDVSQIKQRIDDNQVYNSIKNDFKSVNKFLESVQDKYAIDL